MYSGVPCHFKKNGGCGIYKDRPKNPCKQYKCEWLKDIEIRKEEAVTEIGFFADEVNPIIPSAAPKGFDGLYGFNDRAVIATLVKAIQEQQEQIQELKNKLS
jgi:hypothetical protein